MTDLDALLDRMGEAARRADFATLAACAPEVEAAMASLPALTDRDEAERLQAKARRNARLLDAAQRGLAAARRRSAELRAGGTRLRTYDRSGRAAEILPPSQPMRRF